MKFCGWCYERDPNNKYWFVVAGPADSDGYRDILFRIPNEELARFLCEAPNMYELIHGMRNIEYLRHYIREDKKGGNLLKDIRDLLSRVEGRF